MIAGFSIDIKELNTLKGGGYHGCYPKGTESRESRDYTDVSGIMTADPVSIERSKVTTNYVWRGSAGLRRPVIHPRAVEVAMRNNITVAVRTQAIPGTLITGEFAAARS